jgi:hypothetical protein
MKKPPRTAAMRIQPPACRLVQAAMAPAELLANIGRSHRLGWVRDIMTVEGFTVFPTAIGHCGLAWAEQRIIGARLPEGSEPQTRARMDEPALF